MLSLLLLLLLLQIMKSDEDVRMISAEAPVLFAKVSITHTWWQPPSQQLVETVQAARHKQHAYPCYTQR